MTRDITADMKPHVKKIVSQSHQGDVQAQRIIDLHRMHVACPQDPVAYGILCAAFDEWEASQ